MYYRIILLFHINLKKAWRFNTNTPQISAQGLLQGVAIKFGKGRVVVLGDSAMIFAHLIEKKRNPVGLMFFRCSYKTANL